MFEGALGEHPSTQRTLLRLRKNAMISPVDFLFRAISISPLEISEIAGFKTCTRYHFKRQTTYRQLVLSAPKMTLAYISRNVRSRIVRRDQRDTMEGQRALI